MPPLQTLAKMLAKVTFEAQMKKLPINWKMPMGNPAAKQYIDAFPMAEHAAGGPPSPRPFFHNATPLKDHADTAKKIGGQFKDFMDEAMDKTLQAVDMFRAQAKFKDLKVMAVCAIGAPGCFDGPKLKDTPPYSAWQGKNDNEKKWIKNIVTTMTDNWDKWASKVTVPGLPWYPLFAALPMPTAPPTPAIPMPLIVCISAMMSALAVSMSLKKELCDNHDSGLKDKDEDKQFEAFYTAFATGFSTVFLMWLPMQMIMACLGKGPAPGYAPPYVPFFPVTGGDNVAAPGHVAA